MNEWKYIDEYDSLPAFDLVYCDTRDFYILGLNNQKATVHNVLKGIRHSANYGTLNDCKFRRDEILGTLKTLENESGGKGKWRYLTTDSHPEWLKCIRFIKTTETIEVFNRIEPIYIAYTTYNNYEILSRKILNEKINQKYLNFIKE